MHKFTAPAIFHEAPVLVCFQPVPAIAIQAAVSSMLLKDMEFVIIVPTILQEIDAINAKLDSTGTLL